MNKDVEDTAVNAEPVDRYGNREGELKYCCFPDCGCDGARLCMAEEGPSRGSTLLNIEKGTKFDERG